MATRPGEDDAEARHLEALWSGKFGDAYTERNTAAGQGRERFWKYLYSRGPMNRILEIGCNVGANLKWIDQATPGRLVCGVDINRRALAGLRKAAPAVRVCASAARQLPFRDGAFDLVFTAGVLIHQPESSLMGVLGEVVRCSRSYILCIEYYSSETVGIPYRGQIGALFKRDYGGLYLKHFPELRRLEEGRLDRAEGWDDVTFWLLEKSE